MAIDPETGYIFRADVPEDDGTKGHISNPGRADIADAVHAPEGVSVSEETVVVALRRATGSMPEHRASSYERAVARAMEAQSR